MADNDDYCDNCGDVCDGCCGGANKKRPTNKDHVDSIVKMIMSHGLHIARLVNNELTKQIHDSAMEK